MKEVWKDIKGYGGLYQVNNYGKVKSLARKRNNQYDDMVIMLKFQEDKDGYLRVGLKKNSVKSMYMVHRLVAEAFVFNPDNKSQINHKDGIKIHNEDYNLEWCTCKENINHAFGILGHTVKKGINRGEKCGKSKLCREQIVAIRNSNLSGRKLALVYGVSFVQINRIKSNKSWGWL